jgi:2-polyprenyl-6-methoxyphenol hydroxylase-like FAD-dependent oxidoreductase
VVEKPLAIGIVGAGTAGAAAATFLARAGHRVDLLECVPNPGPVGAGITLQPTGQYALARLGLREHVESHGARIDQLVATRRGGKPLVNLPYASVDPRLYGVGIHRGVLFQALFDAAKATTANVTCGVKIDKSIVRGETRVLVDDKGVEHGPYDLIIAADGSVCELHADAPRVKTKPYPYGALWYVTDDVDDHWTKQHTLHQAVDGAQHMLGFLPTGRTPGGTQRVVSLYWSIRADRVDAWRAGGLSAWRDQVLRVDPRAEAILDTVKDLSRVVFSRYRDVDMWPWHGDRIVFLGDAAHAMSPQLGQGANLALMDAMTLADCIASEPSVPAALECYSRTRRRHLAFYQFATRALTPMFQSDSKVLGWLRDVVFPHSRWFSPLRYRMVRAMCGIDRGIIRGPMKIADLLAPG